MLQALRQTMQKYDMASSGDHIVACVSGGADSVAMLCALCELRADIAYTVTALHINHRLRGVDADADESFVAYMCKKMELRCVTVSADVLGFSKRERISVEDAGRRLRYQIFESTRLELSAQKIAVAHNQNDNMETVFMHLCRGAGLSGLSGIPPVRDGTVIRPLIETPRTAIERYLRDNGIPYRIDATNAENDYLRNRVRNVLIPAVTQIFGEGAIKAVTRSAATAREEDGYMSLLAGQAFCDCLTGCAEAANTVSFDINRLTALPGAMQSRVIRLGLERLSASPLTDITHNHIQRIRALMHNSSGKQIHLPHGIRICRVYGLILLQSTKEPHAQKYPEVPSYSYALQPGHALHIPEAGYYIVSRESGERKGTSIMKGYTPVCTKTFNCDIIKNGLLVRTRHPGDRIYLTGTGAKKMQDYFTDCKTPRNQRDKIPLLADGDEILWIMDNANRANGRYAPVPGNRTVSITLYAYTGGEPDGLPV